ncbi:plasmid pRiA4b ORF-3 family protein [Agromyces laixinhei]|uniref:plasmid pRiA4b ORF-3 family protein n=1 Tax=Agromyces laixinhei TaxID=2585717 RepID=UPI00143D8A78|nr:plasmid pRiA4b ORF-3 family protein [Agromyces laixinhei]
MTSRERFRLRISLLRSSPEIWRTIDVDGALRLDELHDAIQIAMGWRDSHLHEFTETDPHPQARGLPQIGRPVRRWMPDDQLAEEQHDAEFTARFGGPLDALGRTGPAEQLIDEHEADVASVFDQSGGPIYYWYDFGDDWWHLIELIEREGVDAPGASQPKWERRVELVSGDRRGPFEDSGGVHGYDQLVERLADDRAPEHAEAAGWVAFTTWPDALPQPFDPEAFDRDGVDDELRLRFELGSDMSGLVLGRDDDPVDETAPLVELLTALAPPLRSVLRRRLRAAGALDPVVIDIDTAERMVRPFTWLLRRVGADGLTLTKAGWMPPATVREGMTALGWIDEWFGTANREDNTSPIRELRAAARTFGLVRVAKGRLLRTANGTKLADDPIALWRFIATALVERRRGEADRLAAMLVAVEVACGGDGELQPLSSAVARGLDALGWRRPDNWPLAADDARYLVRPIWYTLGQLAVFGPDHDRVFAWPLPPRPPVAEGRAFARAMLGIR